MATTNLSHPYLPQDLQLPHYVANDKSMVEILATFFSIVAVLLVVTWVYSGRLPHLKGRLFTRGKLCWFVACAFIHTILEGYFSVYHNTFPGEQSLLAQIWKEYSKGDSRYASADTFTVCMETITAFIDGPLSVLAAWAFFSKRPDRYLIQLILSMCQLYGDVLYFATEVKEGFVHGPYLHPQYFWFYFVFMNMIWIVIPLACIVESYVELNAAQESHDSKVVVSERKSQKYTGSKKKNY